MKMICQLTTVFVGIFFLQSTVVDAKANEFLEMKVFNHEFRVSDSEMHAMLMKANLEGHGYKKEVTTKLVQKADGGKEYQKAHYYYKNVSCTQMEEVEQQLERLLPDAFQEDVGTKFKEEIKTRHLSNMGQCRVGLEVHFKEEEGCYNNQKDVAKRRKKRDCQWWCIICVDVTIDIDIDININNSTISG